MKHTKIEWCDSTWNPVTGCLHGCEYCYAREIAKRFGGFEPSVNGTWNTVQYEKGGERLAVLNGRQQKRNKNGELIPAPYPFVFYPTLHKYRLNEFQDMKSRNIFVCSMADLFGAWVPDSWIEEVFNACNKAPQHNYLFLTKNPHRYVELAEKGILRCSDNMWYGWSETSESNKPGIMYFPNILPNPLKTFISVEPILGPIRPHLADWIIVGAETGRRKDKVIPERKWIEQIVEDCRKYEIPVFMKDSLAGIWGEPLIQEFPESMKRIEK